MKVEGEKWQQQMEAARGCRKMEAVSENRKCRQEFEAEGGENGMSKRNAGSESVLAWRIRNSINRVWVPFITPRNRKFFRSPLISGSAEIEPYVLFR